MPPFDPRQVLTLQTSCTIYCISVFKLFIEHLWFLHDAPISPQKPGCEWQVYSTHHLLWYVGIIVVLYPKNYLCTISTRQQTVHRHTFFRTSFRERCGDRPRGRLCWGNKSTSWLDTRFATHTCASYFICILPPSIHRVSVCVPGFRCVLVKVQSTPGFHQTPTIIMVRTGATPFGGAKNKNVKGK